MATDRSQTAEELSGSKKKSKRSGSSNRKLSSKQYTLESAGAEAKEQENRRAKISKLLEKLAQLHEHSG
jgi:hypothetical protein